MASYASAKLAVDVATEGYWKRKQAEYAEDRRSDQEESQSLWGFVTGVAGAIIAGPVGYAVGSAIGTGIADVVDDAETTSVDVGRFNRAAVDTYNDDLDDYDKDSNWAQVIGLGTDLAFAWTQAGGLDAFKAVEMDLTKWMTTDGPKTTSEVIKSAFGKKTKEAAITAGTDIAEEITSGTDEIIKSLDEVEASVSNEDIVSALDTTKDPVNEVTGSIIDTSAQLTNDFSNIGNFDSAFAAARKQGLMEFIWNGKKYSTQLDSITLSQGVFPATDDLYMPQYAPSVNDNLQGY